MADPLALYASVMGRLWEDERIRGQAAARIDARLAGRRQGRSFARVGSLSARNALKAASGQSRAAVFKRIRAGGCKTRASLGAQISYINDKAIYTYSTMTNALTDAAVLSEEQKEDIIEDWAGTWRGSTKLGFTSHMLLSFPTDVTVDQAKPEVRFQSGGDPNVDVQQGEAKVRVTGAEKADVQVQQGKAEVRFEEGDESARDMQRQAANDAARNQRDRQQAQQQAEMRTERERIILVMQQHPMFGARVDEIVGDDVYSANGEDVGDVERMAISGDRIYAIVGVGGILGLGDREVALPINRLAFADDRVTLPRLTEEDLESMPDIDMERYREIPMQRTLRQAYEAR